MIQQIPLLSLLDKGETMIYKDDFGNTAKIEKVKLFAYRGATEKENGFRLWITSDYDSGFLYHVSVYETEKDALKKLESFSCGTFKKVEGRIEK